MEGGSKEPGETRRMEKGEAGGRKEKDKEKR